MAKKTDSYEKKLDELTQIVSSMENDDLNIDDAVKLYKKGINLSVDLAKSLEQIEKDIFELKKEADEVFTLDKMDIN